MNNDAKHRIKVTVDLHIKYPETIFEYPRTFWEAWSCDEMSLNPYKHQPCVEADVVITRGVSKLHIFMSCLMRSDVFPPKY
jgi:hypothetical protein